MSGSPKSPSSQPFLSVSVTDPVKLGNGVQSYISYRVITKVNFFFLANLVGISLAVVVRGLGFYARAMVI